MNLRSNYLLVETYCLSVAMQMVGATITIKLNSSGTAVPTLWVPHAAHTINHIPQDILPRRLVLPRISISLQSVYQYIKYLEMYPTWCLPLRFRTAEEQHGSG